MVARKTVKEEAKQRWSRRELRSLTETPGCWITLQIHHVLHVLQKKMWKRRGRHRTRSVFKCSPRNSRREKKALFCKKQKEGTQKKKKYRNAPARFLAMHTCISEVNEIVFSYSYAYTAARWRYGSVCIYVHVNASLWRRIGVIEANFSLHRVCVTLLCV